MCCGSYVKHTHFDFDQKFEFCVCVDALQSTFFTHVGTISITYDVGTQKNHLNESVLFKVGNRPVNMHIDQTSGHYWF